MDRLSQRLLFCVWALSALPQLACTLITDVDRSKIPAPPVIAPDPVPESTDAGAQDAGGGDAGDAASPTDAGADAAPELDAGAVETGDAQVLDAG